MTNKNVKLNDNGTATITLSREAVFAGVKVKTLTMREPTIGDQLVVDVEDASGAGVDVPRFLLSRVSNLLDLRYRIPALPFGMKLTGVRPTPGGVVVDVLGTDTVLNR